MLAAVSPLLVYNSWWFLTNTFMYFILALGVYCLLLVQEDKDPNPFYLFSSGVCFGIATLSVQYGTVFYIPLPFIWAYMINKKKWKKMSLIVTIGLLLPLSVWSVRNYNVFNSNYSGISSIIDIIPTHNSLLLFFRHILKIEHSLRSTSDNTVIDKIPVLKVFFD